MGFFARDSRTSSNRRGKRAIGVRATEVLLYLVLSSRIILILLDANLELSRVPGAGTFLLLLHVVITFVKKIFIPWYHIINVVYVLVRGLSNILIFFVTYVRSLYVFTIWYSRAA